MLDVAHNEQGFSAVLERISQMTKGRVYVVCGFSKVKDMSKIVEMMAKAEFVH